MPEQTRRERRVLIGLGLVLILAAIAFMVVGAKGSWSFILPFRGTKLVALLMVGYAIAVSTVIFQTVTGNRILTPGIMGFDALFVTIQTVLAFVMGATAMATLDPRMMFGAQVAVMTAASLGLYAWLFLRGRHSLHLVLLVGIVLGVFLRSISGFLQRILDPQAFVVLQDRLFASFNSVDPNLMGASAVLLGVMSLLGLRILPRLDVLHLGRDGAIALGVPYRKTVLQALAVVAVMVSVSTALVGPVTFLGLIVANLGWMMTGSHRHRVVLPAAVLTSWVLLVGGQTFLERVLGYGTVLGVVIEFFGGLFFLYLLLRGRLR